MQVCNSNPRENLKISSIQYKENFGMWNSNKNKQEFDGRCCVAPLMASKTVDRNSSPQLQINNGIFRQDPRKDSLDNTTTSTISTPLKPHTGGDPRWEAINDQEHPLGLANFRVLKRLGYGDIGSVYLVELRGSGGAHFAMKVMDKASLVSRNKVLRADTERDILGLLDHPFLPTLYTHFETDKFYCLVMEFCSGGNLHSLRQKQPNKYFTEEAARFYALEVLLALEYLHMLGIVYRDLKPENVLIRDNGHIMLSDFDLSLRCSVSPTLVPSFSSSASSISTPYQENNCIQPSSFLPKLTSSKKSGKKLPPQASSLPELMAEPTDVRSMSFVGTHEYLAPEIIRGEGHGSAVDWWTLGVFLYELLHGTTPFKGQGNRATLFNVVGEGLKFPDAPQASGVARDLIKGLLVKEPSRRIAYKRGATEVKQHPFFEGVNWALVRSACPPHVPNVFDFSRFKEREPTGSVNRDGENKKAVETASESGDNHMNGHDGNDNSNKNDILDDESSYVDFEYF